MEYLLPIHELRFTKSTIMKKNKLPLESHFWTEDGIEKPFKIFEAVFDYSNLENHKNLIADLLQQFYKKKMYRKREPGDLLLSYKMMRSFLKACYLMQFSKKTVRKDDFYDWDSGIFLGSLSSIEYDNPVLVFTNAFKKKTLVEYELFLFAMFQFSLSTYKGDICTDMATPYLHLIKMLDAAQLIQERGLEKVTE